MMTGNETTADDQPIVAGPEPAADTAGPEAEAGPVEQQPTGDIPAAAAPAEDILPVNPAAAAPRTERPPLRGRLERFDKRRVIGWAFDPTNPAKRVTVEIVVGERVVATVVADAARGDLRRLKIGDGNHGFGVTLPKDVFDGETKTIVGRDADSGALLLSVFNEWTFDAVFGEAVVGKAVGVSDGRLCGYVYDPGDSDVVFEIVGRSEGAQRFVGFADDMTFQAASADSAADRGGFALPLSADEFGRFVSGDFKLYAMPGDIPLPPSAVFLSGLATLDVETGEQDVAVAHVTLSPAVARKTDFDVYVDDTLVSKLSWSPSFRQRTLPLYLERQAGAANRLSVRFAGTDTEIENSPQSLWKGIRRDAVSNGRFEVWEGAAPRAWTVAAPRGVSATKLFEPARALRKGLIGEHGVRFEAASEGSSLAGLTVSQTFCPGDVLAGSPLNVIVAGRGEQTVDVLVTLTLPSGAGDGSEGVEGSFASVERTLRFEPGVALRSVALQTPATDILGAATLSVVVTGSAGARFDLMLVAMGAPGFEVAPASSTEPAHAETPNAVMNAGFTDWSTRFVTRAVERRQGVAHGWTLSTRQPSPGVECRLASLVTRDVHSGDSGELAYGLSMLGPVTGPYLRMEGLLDPFALADVKSLEFSFYAKTADALASVPAQPSRIREIYVIHRSTRVSSGVEEAFHDQTVAKLGRDVNVSRTGQRHRMQLSERDVAALRERARSLLYDPAQSLLITFQWTEQADCTLTEISLAPKKEVVQSRTVGVIAIEDPNIAAQLGLLKGLEAWRSNRLTPPAPLQPLVQTPAAWAWPETLRSLDIVIPVFNAVDDTLECLASLERHTKAPHRVVVVDDASEGSAAAQIDRFAATRPWIRVIRNAENQGYTKSANIGMSASNSEWVILLNSDTIVTPDWLEGLFEAADARPDAAMIGPVSNAASWQSVPDLYDAKGKWRINPIPEGVTIDSIAATVRSLAPRDFPEVPLLNGFCTLIRRSALDEVGYLDEIAFPVGYGEENDLCIRVGAAGHALIIADHVYVYHKKSASFGLSRRDALSKAGTASFKAKHPEVDLRELQLRFTEIPALNTLRVQLRERLGVAAPPGPALPDKLSSVKPSSAETSPQ